MTEARLKLGQQGEEAAAAFLIRKGMKILQRNLRTPVGEIDLLARQKLQLVFVEVKTRRGTAFGLPEEAVGLRKQRQIIRAAQWYLSSGAGDGMHPRFDVVSVIVRGEEFQCRHIPDAFDV